MGRKQMINNLFRPVRDEIITTCRFSTHIKSLSGLKYMLNRFFNSLGEAILISSAVDIRVRNWV